MKYRLETSYTQYGTNVVWIEETDDLEQVEMIAKSMIRYSNPAGYVDLPEAVTVIDTESGCLLYTSPSPRDRTRSRMPSSA